MAEHLRQAPDLLPTLLTTLFEIVLFEDCSNQWSLSRPMLSLILVNEQARALTLTLTHAEPDPGQRAGARAPRARRRISRRLPVRRERAGSPGARQAAPSHALVSLPPFQ